MSQPLGLCTLSACAGRTILHRLHANQLENHAWVAAAAPRQARGERRRGKSPASFRLLHRATRGPGCTFAAQLPCGCVCAGIGMPRQ